MVNKIILIGRLGSDTEPKKAKNGRSYTTMRLATTSGYYDANNKWTEKTDWHNVIAWWEVNAKKGETICIDGELTYYTVNDTQTAQILAKSVKTISNKGGAKKVPQIENIELGDDLPF